VIAVNRRGHTIKNNLEARTKAQTCHEAKLQHVFHKAVTTILEPRWVLTTIAFRSGNESHV